MVASLAWQEFDSEEFKIEQLRQFWQYPIKERDPSGSRFWLLRSGDTIEQARETCPIAVSFFSELNTQHDSDIKPFLISDQLDQTIRQHYTSQVAENQPVMYLLLPTKTTQGQIALIRPSEVKLRQNAIQTFSWSDPELIARFHRLKQQSLSIANLITEQALCYVPQIDWLFYQTTKTAPELALAIAKVTLKLETAIPLDYQTEPEDGYLHQLFKSFQLELLPNLTLASDNNQDYSFADIYAQTISYGLFTARIFAYQHDLKHQKTSDFNRFNAWSSLPKTNPFLRDLFKSISTQVLSEELLAPINELLGLLRAAKMEAILSDYKLNINREDIVIHFYEEFIKAYKPKMRETRGVYYTPLPVVSYIIRSVDIILKQEFGLPAGLADASKITCDQSGNHSETHQVLITDPAVGTGTFLHEVIKHIYQSLELTPDQWSDYVEHHLLPRLLGFELLMAPYAIAHLKLGLQLSELGYQFESDQRLRVYLTNTLQEAFQLKSNDNISNLIWGEANAANSIKEIAPVMVIMGNPPYAGHSVNNGAWIKNLLKGKDILTNSSTHNYFELDGLPLGEKNPKWLNDDYVKFIRFAQWRIEKTGYGILAFVTNHGYLDNPTFRGMRQSLLTTFDQIYILDLHGNSLKKETTPDGSKDENVFDIQQGVAIGIFVKNLKKNCNLAAVYHLDLWGQQNLKYYYLAENSINTTEWKTLQPQAPFYLFVPQNTDNLFEYNQGWSIKDIFSVNSSGILTGRDAFVIDIEYNALLERIEKFLDISNSDQEIQNKFSLNENYAWRLSKARQQLSNYASHNQLKTLVKQILYRPFDTRYIFYHPSVVWRIRDKVMCHMLAGENIALITSRLTKGETFHHAQVTNHIVEVICMSPKTSNNGFVFPLYLYPTTDIENQMGIPIQPNLSPDFLKAITEKLKPTPTPEAIFHYIYAILHSPTYRDRYAQFLKIDFPRIPLTSNNDIFEQLSNYGSQLVQLHLMTSDKLNHPITQFVAGTGNLTIDPRHPQYEDTKVILNKGKDQFIGVDQAVWEFYVGGYQPCQKWLKDRKGRTLSDADILHYQKIVTSLKETIAIMTKIDQTISFPIK